VLGNQGRVTQINALATYWFHPAGGHGVYLVIGVATIASAMLFAVLAMFDIRAGLAVLVLGMVGVQAFVMVPDWRDAAEIRSRQHVLADLVRTRFPTERCVTLLGSRSYGWHAANYDYYLGGIRTERVQSRRPELCGDLYIGQSGDARLDRLDGYLVALENDVPLELWIAASAVEAGDDATAWFPGDPHSALPDEATSAVIERVGPDSPLAAGDVITVYVEHTGSGSPWPNLKGLGSGTGFVQVGVRWSGPDGEFKNDSFDLPRTMLPGDSVEMAVRLDATGLAAGTYDVVIDLVQQGVARFGAERTEPIRLAGVAVE
jgi:hypothetical protein